MKAKILTWAVILGCAVIALTALALGQSGDVAVVVNPQNPTSSIAMGDLRKIISGGKRYWPGGAPIKLFTRPEGTTERNAMLKVLGMSETEYKQYWAAKVYQGDAQAPPVSLPSNGMQKEALNAYPGAIALVGFNDVKPGMKVVKIDGKMPGEEGYPLQP